jgi:protein TIF31
MIDCLVFFQAITNEGGDNKVVDDKKRLEEDEAKKIVESITDSITSGEKKDIEESTRDIVKKAALAVGSLKETEFDIRYFFY